MNRALLVLVVACQPPGSSHPSQPEKQFELLDLVGGWRWIYRTQEGNTTRVEDEVWRLKPDPTMPSRLVGRYIRTVEVSSTDRTPFTCNQRLSYRQRAMFDVVAELRGPIAVIRETAYKAEQSPCDHGFRHMSEYRIETRGNRLVLRWDKGTQTLWQLDDTSAPLPDPPWTDVESPLGAWRWQASSYDAQGNVRDEAEWWEISRRSDTRLDATYRRRVTVRSPDGKPIACAHAPTWSFDDAYVLSAQKEEEHWHFYELAVEPGDHPCLRATPRRTLDEATAEQIGDFLVVEWRGKRRQVLYRAPE